MDPSSKDKSKPGNSKSVKGGSKAAATATAATTKTDHAPQSRPATQSQLTDDGAPAPLDGGAPSKSDAPAASTKKLSKKMLYNSRCKPGGDIFNPIAIENAYYICHNVQDCLMARGFAWQTDTKGKKKGRK